MGGHTTYSTYLDCSTRNCWTRKTFTTRKKDDLQDVIAARGWRLIGGHWYCKKCVAKLEAENHG